MIWVAWRQSRTQALVAFGLLALLAALVVMTGLHLRDVYSSLGGAHCADRCGLLIMTDHTLAKVLGPALVTIPVLLGMFWGAPLIARELESGTYRLAWTQSVTRQRWLLVTVAVVGLTALAVAGLASWLVSWWYAPDDAALMNRLDPIVFSTHGIVAVGYAGFAFALGVATGALARRTLPAMAVTLVGFAGALAASTFWLLSHLPFTTHIAVSATRGNNLDFASSASGAIVRFAPTPIPNGLVISSRLVDRTGHAISTARLHALVVHACPAFVPRQQIPAGVPKSLRSQKLSNYVACMHQLSHHLQALVTYQPPSHYWLLQALVTAIFLAAAAVLIAATVWRVSRRATPKPTADQPREHASQRFAPKAPVPADEESSTRYDPHESV